MIKKISFLFLSFFLLTTTTFAHNPRLVMWQTPTSANPIKIENPDVSQVFYGELKNSEEYYEFEILSNQAVTFQILAPIFEKNFSSAQIFDQNGMIIDNLSATNYEKGASFEEFGGDYYINGPEKDIDLTAGRYQVKISNAGNIGKYAFVIGKKESFPLKEILYTYTTLPLIKEVFFGKPVYELFTGILGIILILVSLICHFYKKSHKKLFLTGLLIFLIGTIFLTMRNPFNILGMLKVTIAIIAIGHDLASFPKTKLKQRSIIVSYILWSLVVFLTIAQ